MILVKYRMEGPWHGYRLWGAFFYSLIHGMFEFLPVIGRGDEAWEAYYSLVNDEAGHS